MDKYINDEEKYGKHTEISMEVLEYLVSKKVNMIGIDTLWLGVGRNHGISDSYLGNRRIRLITSKNISRILIKRA